MAPASIGDLQNNLRKLEKVLRAVRYGGEIDFAGLARGAVSAYIPIYEYLFTSYHRAFSERLCSDGIELAGKVDYAFVKAVYKALRDLFGYKSPITIDQFFSDGFVERKAIMAVDVIELVCRHYAPPATTQRYMQAKASKLLSTSDAKKLTRDTTLHSRDSANVTSATGHPFDDMRRVPRARYAAAAADENGPSDEVGPMSRNPVCLLRSRSIKQQDSSDADVPAKFRVQREHVPTVHRVPTSDDSAADPRTPAAVDVTLDDRHCSVQRPSRKPVACTAATAVTADQPEPAPSVGDRAYHDALAQVAAAVAQSMESVNQRLKAMEERLDALTSSVASAAGQPTVAAAAASRSEGTTLETENLAARVALLESRLTTLSSTVVSRLATFGSHEVHSAAATQPAELEQAAATVVTVHPASIASARGCSTGAHHSVNLGRCTSSGAGDSSFPVSTTAGHDSSGSSRCGSCSVEGASSSASASGDGSFESPGLRAEPPCGGGSEPAPTSDRQPEALSSSGSRCLTTPDRAKVTKISQMLEGTMKMLRGK